MAKKPNASGRPGAAAPKTAPAQAAKPQPAKQRPPVVADKEQDFFDKHAKLLIPAIIAVLTFFFFKNCLNNKLTNWDDLGYIITNPVIKNSSWEGIKNVFSWNGRVMGNYHPLTILLYTIEYSYKGLEPFIYHFDSVLLHVCTTLAVYFFTRLLTGRTVAATVVALLFGIHPMHVESVAWAAGRKDVLYGLFYILACSTYIRYVRAEQGQKAKWYVAGLLLFALSLLAKSVAVTLPVTLFVFDYLEKRKWSWSLLIEKLPFFALSLTMGIISVLAQKDIGALGTLDAHFEWYERFALGCYALTGYLWKAIVPAGLTNFYPYPLQIGNAMPGVYYVYPVIIIALGFVIWKFAKHNKVVFAGIAFFLINIILLLQFLPVGGAIMSDRYGYIPYWGLFFIIGWYVSEFYANKASGKVVFGASLAYCLALGFVTSARCNDWYDSVSLWKDNIEKHPDGPVGYFYLGQEYFSRYESSTNPNEKKALGDSALYAFNMSIERKPDYINPIICVAELQRNYGLIDDAKATYLRAMKISDKNESVYLGLGVIYSIKRQFDSAGIAFRKGLALKKYFPEGHSNYANYLDIIGQTDSSLKEYGIAIEQNPDAFIPYMNRGRIYLFEKKQFDPAIADYSTAMQIKPENPEPYYMRAKAYAAKGMKAQALKDVETATKMGYTQVEPAFVQQLK